MTRTSPRARRRRGGRRRRSGCVPRRPVIGGRGGVADAASRALGPGGGDGEALAERVPGRPRSTSQRRSPSQAWWDSSASRARVAGSERAAAVTGRSTITVSAGADPPAGGDRVGGDRQGGGVDDQVAAVVDEDLHVRVVVLEPPPDLDDQGQPGRPGRPARRAAPPREAASLADDHTTTLSPSRASAARPARPAPTGRAAPPGPRRPARADAGPAPPVRSSSRSGDTERTSRRPLRSGRGGGPGCARRPPVASGSPAAPGRRRGRRPSRCSRRRAGTRSRPGRGRGKSYSAGRYTRTSSWSSSNECPHLLKSCSSDAGMTSSSSWEGGPARRWRRAPPPGGLAPCTRSRRSPHRNHPTTCGTAPVPVTTRRCGRPPRRPPRAPTGSAGPRTAAAASAQVSMQASIRAAWPCGEHHHAASSV